MNVPEIERLISEAIANRPSVTCAPMNLYIHNGVIVCGARAVMPGQAIFIAHILPQHLEKGLSEQEWKNVVERVTQITAMRPLVGRGEIKPLSEIHRELEEQINANRSILNDRRKERRLRYRRPIWFTEDANNAHCQGQMVDISSGGVLFTCCSEEKSLHPNQQITTRFSIPRVGPDNTVENVTIDRVGRVCRVEKSGDYLHRVAVQFATPLPFKPAEQGLPEFDAGQKPGTAGR